MWHVRPGCVTTTFLRGWVRFANQTCADRIDLYVGDVVVEVVFIVVFIFVLLLVASVVGSTSGSRLAHAFKPHRVSVLLDLSLRQWVQSQLRHRPGTKLVSSRNHVPSQSHLDLDLLVIVLHLVKKKKVGGMSCDDG